MIFTLEIKTGEATQMIDITGRVSGIVKESGTREGVCFIFVPHTTAGLVINENADPSVSVDILEKLNKLVPFNEKYRHLEGNSAAHIKSSLTGVSQTVFITGGRLLLGTWQGIYLCEFDGPRSRKVLLRIIDLTE